MKKKIQQYSFVVLSVVVIGFFFTFTGGVHDGNSVQLSPPEISFIGFQTSMETGEYTAFSINIVDNDPGHYTITTTCDVPPAPPQSGEERESDPSPEYRLELYSSGTNLGELPDAAYIDLGFSLDSYVSLSVDNYIFNQPGSYQIAVTARTRTYTVTEYVNGELVQGTGLPLFSEWITVMSPTITVTGPTTLTNNRYYFDKLVYTPATGDPNPPKTYTFADTSRQYLDIVNAVKANLKFYWTPPASDTTLYRNLASKYEFNITDAVYSVVDEDGNPSTSGYDLTLHYGGQSVKFSYENTPDKILSFTKPSKTIAGQNDKIEIYFKQ